VDFYYTQRYAIPLTGDTSMDWTQAFTVMGVLGGFMFFILQRIEGDINRVESRMDRIDTRLDGHAQRIDQIYSVILSILKEKKL